MAGILKELLKERAIDKDTRGRTYSYQDYLICEIEYKGGRLMIVKNYQNTVEGRNQLDVFLRSIQTGEDVEKYFKLKGGLKMSLESVVEEAKKNTKFANEKVEGGNPSTFVGRVARQKSAKERLKQLYTQYEGQLKTHSVFVVVSGDGATDFAEVAAKEADFLVGNTDSFYEYWASKIDPKLYKNPVGSSFVMDVMSRHFEDIARELDIDRYNQIICSQKFNTTVKNKDDLLKLVKKVTNEIVGAEVAALYVFKKLAREAFDSHFQEKIFPVMIVAGTDTAAAIATGFKTINPRKKDESPRVFTVSVGENGLVGAAHKAAEVNTKTVNVILNKIKKEVTNKKENNKNE